MTSYLDAFIPPFCTPPCAAGSNLVGPVGPTGVAGSSGALDFGDFYAIMPPDNAVALNAGDAIAFPRTNVAGKGGITSNLLGTIFTLSAIGSYMVTFQASVTPAAQIVMVLNGAEQTAAPFDSVVGRAPGTNQMMGMYFITTIAANTTLQFWNPLGDVVPLVLEPAAGGTGSLTVSAHLTIVRIA